MANEYKLSYTGTEINEKLSRIPNKTIATAEQVDKFGGTVEITADAPVKENTVLILNPNSNEANIYEAREIDEMIGRVSEEIADKQPKGNYALKSEIPTVPVQSVNGKTGAVELNASDVGATTEAWVNAQINTLKAQGVQQVPLFANSIEECTDTTKMYVLPDGFIYAYKNVDSTGINYTNVLDNTEIQLNKRWSHSGKQYSAQNGHVATGYIPVKFGDVVRINRTATKHGVIFTQDYHRVHYFDASGNYVAGHVDGATGSLLELTEESEDVTSWIVGYEAATGISNGPATKLSGADDIATMIVVYRVTPGTVAALTEDDVADLIITVNEPIEETTVTGYQWVNTGHAFVPADYENIINKLKEQTSDHTGRINALEKAVETGGVDENEKAAYTRIKEWRYPIYEDAPVFLLDTDKPAITTSEQNTDAVYAKYDALMNENTHYITKINCGMASDGTTPIYVYHFKEPEPHYASPIWSETKPVILICSGVHPTEQTGVHSLYHAMEEITTNPKLIDLRRNVHFIVMPMINPTGFTDSTYGVRNPDGIQVHYNFEVDFKYPTDAGYVANGNRNHGGETPLSIPETQYFDAIMNEYKDTLACVVSCHNNDVDVSRGTGYIWCSCATHFMCNLGFRLVDKMSMAWREKYGTAFDEGIRWANEYALAQAAAGSSLFNSAYVYEQEEWDYRVGMASLSGSGGTEYKQALKYGVHGINVETCDRCMILDKDFSKKRTANVITMGTETYINFFRTFMAVYDRKDKKDYAPNLPWEG